MFLCHSEEPFFYVIPRNSFSYVILRSETTKNLLKKQSRFFADAQNDIKMAPSFCFYVILRNAVTKDLL